MDDLTTPETIADGVDVAPADGGGAEEPSSVSLDELRQVLGKDFKDPQMALKSIKDTFSYVGSQAKYKETVSTISQKLGTDEKGVLQALEKLMEQPENTQQQAPAPVATDGFITKEQYQEDIFFSKNQNLEAVRDILTPLKNASGKDMSWQDFVNTDQAKKVVDTFAGYQEYQGKQSVLESNPRLGAVSNKMSEAARLQQEADQAARQGDMRTAYQAQEAATKSVIAGVIDAYDLK